MSKIIINSRISSNDDEETLNSVKAIKKDNKITYNVNDVKVGIIICSNKVFLERENKDMKLNLEFEKDKVLKTNYVIKDLGIKIKVETKTKELIIMNNSIKIKYELFMNREFSDYFTYELEWSDL